MKLAGIILGLTAALAFAPLQDAAANVIVNGNFAQPSVASSPFFVVTTSIPGWSVSSGGAPTGVWQPPSYSFPQYNGIGTAGFAGNGTPFSGTAIFQQSFGYGISAGSTYTFGAAFFERKDPQVSAPYSLGSYFLEILGGSTVLASLQGPAIATNTWKHLEVSYLGQANVVGNLSVRIRLVGDPVVPNQPRPGYQISFTNATLDVPEPSSIALFGMAMLSLLGFGMMRRRARA